MNSCVLCTHNAENKESVHEKLNKLSSLSNSSGPWACGSDSFLTLAKMNLVLIEFQTQFKSQEFLFLLNQL